MPESCPRTSLGPSFFRACRATAVGLHCAHRQYLSQCRGVDSHPHLASLELGSLPVWQRRCFHVANHAIPDGLGDLNSLFDAESIEPKIVQGNAGHGFLREIPVAFGIYARSLHRSSRLTAVWHRAAAASPPALRLGPPVFAILARAHAHLSAKHVIHPHAAREAHVVGDLLERPLTGGQFAFGPFDPHAADLGRDRAAQVFAEVVLQGSGFRVDRLGSIYASNSPRGTPDCLMIDRKVPARSSR